MAFDGITTRAVTFELNNKLTGGRIVKIAQPEADELLLTIKREKEQYRLLLSASASLPLAYLTEVNKPSPMVAPAFCMLLRKHIQNGKILSITQPGLERIIDIKIQHLDEMGDLKDKHIYIELMGKHSNIIFCTSEDTIIDSIKHISGLVSSVREVLPGREYFIPNTEDKADPLSMDETGFNKLFFGASKPAFKAIYTNFTGLSPIISQEICYRANVDSDMPTGSVTPEGYFRLYKAFEEIMAITANCSFSPYIYYENGVPKEYSAIPLTIYGADVGEAYESISILLHSYYAKKSSHVRIRQKSSDLRHIVQTALERTSRKLDLQQKQLADTEKKDKYRVYGELIHAYGYNVQPGAKSMEAENYYDDNKLITVPLDPLLTPGENAKKYFDKYDKLKRTYEALTELTESVKMELEHLQTILTSLELSTNESDLSQIRQELTDSGYLKKKSGVKREKIKSTPLHYISSDGYDIYVGKNNIQNEELTFKQGTGGDWWFHAKGIPGSHVLLRVNGLEEVPDRAFEEAARLAAYYSKDNTSDKVEIDYTLKKNVKKPAGSPPGFVVYYTNYSMIIDRDISALKEV